MLRHKGFPVVWMVAVLVAACESGAPGTTPPPEDLAGEPSSVLTLADVEARLRDAGFGFERGGRVEQGFLRVAGAALVSPEAELQVYVYGSTTARRADTARLDSARVAPPTMMISWVMPASLATYGNVAVIVLTRDEVRRSRIHQAIARQ